KNLRQPRCALPAGSNQIPSAVSRLPNLSTAKPVWRNSLNCLRQSSPRPAISLRAEARNLWPTPALPYDAVAMKRPDGPNDFDQDREADSGDSEDVSIGIAIEGSIADTNCAWSSDIE